MTFVISIAIIVAIALLAFVGYRVSDYLYFRKYGITRKGYESLSYVSRNTLDKYRELPKDSQRFTDIHSVLMALDAKHINDENNGVVWAHFRYGSINVCDCTRYNLREDCNFYPEFFSIRKELHEISEGVRKKNYILNLKKHEGVDVESFLESLRNENNALTYTNEKLEEKYEI